MTKVFYTGILNRLDGEIAEEESRHMWMYIRGQLDMLKCAMNVDEELSAEDYKDVSDLYIEVSKKAWIRYDVIVAGELESVKESVTS